MSGKKPVMGRIERVGSLLNMAVFSRKITCCNVIVDYYGAKAVLQVKPTRQ
jgi:hypothetical protein